MRRYYETPPQTALVVPLGASKVFAIRHPDKVRLTVLRVLQTTGVAVAFSVDLYNREVPDTPSSNNADDFWLVTPRGGIASDAPGVLVHHFPDMDVFFVNKDDPVMVQKNGRDTPSQVSTTANRVIYVRITNAGANEGTFELILGSEYR